MCGAGGGTTFTSFPIYVAVPEWEVEGVIQACPKDKRADLVFMQVSQLSVLRRGGAACWLGAHHNHTQRTHTYTQSACIESLLKRCEWLRR